MTNPPGESAIGSTAQPREGLGETAWPTHVIRAGDLQWNGSDEPPSEKLREYRRQIEPWLSALLQAEHLALLLGSGLATAVASEAGSRALDMHGADFACEHADVVQRAAKASAESLGRGEPNFEDQIRAVRDLTGGLRVLASGAVAGADAGSPPRLQVECAHLLAEWDAALDSQLLRFLGEVLETERGILHALEEPSIRANELRRLLGSFLLSFASRTASRERLHIFTTNYDRVVEFGCDLLGLRVIDRFVGTLGPVFRSSRVSIDLHYSPPGLRGEPHYLEGVVRLTKLHGSIDWVWEAGPSGNREVKRSSLPFGAVPGHPSIPKRPGDSLLIYPNPAKDVETLEYPYAELFRDFAAATCQPNAVLFTYGYGFGDDHINRVLRDMLTIPSTHVVVMSFDGAAGRIARFCESCGRDEQITLLIGPHFGHLPTLSANYLPKPAIDRTTWRMVELLTRRARPHLPEQKSGASSGEGEATQ